MISSLLVANRAEIAVRIISTARALGIRTVAVYSEADINAPHVRAADEAVCIGGAPAVESYLNIDALLAAAKQTGVEAIHPGYGFLSERPEFAQAVADAGLIFVGPSAHVMSAMARKDAAREIAINAGVPVVPSYGLNQDPAEFTYPVLVKAAAGGGGKGMRVVHEAGELPAAIESARREASSSFGDDTILLERYVERGRHVEVQVFGDSLGNVVHLFERDCSAQRRHQKVIEEAPAPHLSDAAREVLHSSAVALARRVGYENAGTVEYLVAGEYGAEEVFFLEMNTRLQVEHPVTEAITGLDLVEWQLRVSSGEPLPLAQRDITSAGHAFEARVYGEDAFDGFLPQAGVASLVRWPTAARVDQALESGQRVSTWYDPMLAKIIVHGPDREVARRRLVAALDDTGILGLTTNTGFLRALADHSVFAAAEVDTTWLDHNVLTPPRRGDAEQLAAHAVVDRARVDPSPFGAGDGWRAGAEPAVPVVRLDDTDIHVAGPQRDRAVAHQVTDTAVDLAYRGHWFHFTRPQADSVDHTAAGDGSVTAPMPGTVTTVDVQVGQQVNQGDVVGVIEAMKMEVSLKAGITGTVTEVTVRAGDQVSLGEVLFSIELFSIEENE